jgi:nitronate monooxygenase
MKSDMAVMAAKRQEMNEILNRYREKVKLPPLSELVLPPDQSIDTMIDIIIARNIPIVSFTFGMLTREQLSRLKAHNIVTLGTATTVNEAKALKAHGCDIVVAQGYEAGGHRGTFLEPFEQSMIGTMTLVPQIVDAVDMPVVAAGGIMDGRGIAAALNLNASAVQMGTAFLRCPEAGTPQPHKDAITKCSEESTVVTSVFSGKPARGIKNKFIEEMEKEHGKDILPYPDQHFATAPIRKAAAKLVLPEYMSMWAGQGAKQSQDKPAGELVQMFANQALEVLAPQSHVTNRKQ